MTATPLTPGLNVDHQCLHAFARDRAFFSLVQSHSKETESNIAIGGCKGGKWHVTSVAGVFFAITGTLLATQPWMPERVGQAGLVGQMCWSAWLPGPWLCSAGAAPLGGTPEH